MASSTARKKRDHSVKSYKEKLEIIAYAEENPHLKQKAIAEKYAMKPQTLSDLLRNKNAIKAKFGANILSLEIPDVQSSSEDIEVIIVEPSSSHSRKKRKLSTKSFQEKLEIIKFAEENPSLKQKAIALKYNMKPQTLSDLLRNKEVIKATAAESERLQKNTRQRKITHEDVDKALITWYRETCVSGEHVDGETLRQKACYFSKQFAARSEKDVSTDISPSWIERFKKRHGVGRAAHPGHLSRNMSGTCDTWFAVVLPSILHSFAPQDIYSFDETALLWKLLPLDLNHSQLLSDFKSQQDDILLADKVTVVAGVNMDGSDKAPLLVIGLQKNSIFPGKTKWLPVKYVCSRSSCLTKTIFLDYIRELDYQFQLQGRHVAIIINTSIAHPVDSINGLSNITIFYLPVNAKAHMQPLRGGVIRQMKFRYRFWLCKRRLASLEENLPYSYDLLDAVIALSSAWDNVMPDEIKAGFVRAGIALSDVKCSIHNSLISSSDYLDCCNVWNRIAKFHKSLDMMPLDEFIEIDRDFPTVQSLTEEDIIKMVKEDSTSSHKIYRNLHENEVIVLETKNEASSPEYTSTDAQVPSTSEALAAINILQRFWLSRCRLNDLRLSLQEMEDAILSESLYGRNDSVHL